MTSRMANSHGGEQIDAEIFPKEMSLDVGCGIWNRGRVSRLEQDYEPCILQYNAE